MRYGALNLLRDGRVSTAIRVAIFAIHILTFILSGIVAFLLRFDFRLDQHHLPYVYWGLGTWVMIKPLVFYVRRLDRAWWSYASVPDVIVIAISNVAASVASAILIEVFGPSGFPRSIYPLDLLICVHATAGLCVLGRIVQHSRRRGTGLRDRKRIVIYGAGDAGVMLMREI